eukprot:scaffold116775_cov29-Prasinocladus_malaysianus.AAC.1
MHLTELRICTLEGDLGVLGGLESLECLWLSSPRLVWASNVAALRRCPRLAEITAPCLNFEGLGDLRQLTSLRHLDIRKISLDQNDLAGSGLPFLHSLKCDLVVSCGNDEAFEDVSRRVDAFAASRLGREVSVSKCSIRRERYKVANAVKIMFH